MRFAAPVVVALATFTLVACGDDDEAAVLPVAQRFVSAEDAPGSKPDPVERRETTKDYAVFIPALSEHSIDPDSDEIEMAFQPEDFKSAGSDARFFGETHSPENPNHVFSSFIELGSDDGATRALDWLETDQMKPCPESCAVQRSAFDVDAADRKRLSRTACGRLVAQREICTSARFRLRPEKCGVCASPGRSVESPRWPEQATRARAADAEGETRARRQWERARPAAGHQPGRPGLPRR